ncbi:MAG: hypothetical protein JJT96_10365 [Opitutales bacterium]|nr:hypothetical protein [Opitutales bacterium]
MRLCPGRRDQIGASVEADRVAMLAETPEASEYCGAGDRLRARRGRAELAAWRASGGDESSAADVPAFALRATARQAEEIERARGDVERARWLAPVEAGEGGVLGMSEEQWLYLPEAGAKSASATMPRFFWF